jgi:hypothetical protein
MLSKFYVYFTLTAIAAGIRLMLGKIKHKTYLASTITA